MSVFPTPEKTTNMLVNLILPLCIRMGCGRRDCPKIRQADINFALTVILNALVPPSKQPNTTAPKLQHLAVSDLGRTASMTSHSKKAPVHVANREAILDVAFLGLKIMIVCFEKQLSTEWYRIAKCVQDIGNKLLGGFPLWRFIDFVVTVRTPLFMMLQPFIQFRVNISETNTD